MRKKPLTMTRKYHRFQVNILWSLLRLVLIIIYSLAPLNASTQDARTIAGIGLPETVTLQVSDQFGNVISIGSGFYIDPVTVVTNFHVIEGGTECLIVDNNGNQDFSEGILAFNQERDIAVLKVSDQGNSGLSLAVRTPEVGEYVVALGSPQGLSGSVSDGILSSFRTFNGIDYLQITTPISPGSSGGPLLDANGQVIGMTTASITSGQNLNLAVTVESLRHVLERLDGTITDFGVGESKFAQILKSNDRGESPERKDQLEVKKTNSGRDFSIRNNSQFDIMVVKLIAITFDNSGSPVDYCEKTLGGHYSDVLIKKGLAKSYSVFFEFGGCMHDFGGGASNNTLAIIILDFEYSPGQRKKVPPPKKSSELREDSPESVAARKAKKDIEELKSQVSWLTQRINEYPNNADLYYQRAKIKNEIGNWVGAAEDAETALKVDSTHIPAIRLYAQLKMKQLPERTLDHLNRAIGLNPSNIELVGLRAKNYSVLGMKKQAIDEYATILELDPTNSEVRVGLYESYLKMGESIYSILEYDKALEYFRKALKLANSIDDVQTLLIPRFLKIGDIYATRGKSVEAMNVLAEVYRFDPSNPDIQKSLSSAFSSIDDKNLLLNYFKAMLDINPSDAEMCYRIAQTFDSLNKHGEACQYYKKSKEMGFAIWIPSDCE